MYFCTPCVCLYSANQFVCTPLYTCLSDICETGFVGQTYFVYFAVHLSVGYLWNRIFVGQTCFVYFAVHVYLPCLCSGQLCVGQTGFLYSYIHLEYCLTPVFSTLSCSLILRPWVLIKSISIFTLVTLILGSFNTDHMWHARLSFWVTLDIHTGYKIFKTVMKHLENGFIVLPWS